MPKVSLRKIKSARSQTLLLSALVVVLAVLVILVFAVHRDTPKTVNMKLSHGELTLETASTESEQEKGLGGRASMPQDHGMLFVFGSEAQQCFWMKDTRFPLDMVWLDASKHIRAIENDVMPDSYPHVYCHEGKYVIELNAGAADRNNLVVGKKLDL